MKQNIINLEFDKENFKNANLEKIELINELKKDVFFLRKKISELEVTIKYLFKNKN